MSSSDFSEVKRVGNVLASQCSLTLPTSMSQKIWEICETFPFQTRWCVCKILPLTKPHSRLQTGMLYNAPSCNANTGRGRSNHSLTPWCFWTFSYLDDKLYSLIIVNFVVKWGKPSWLIYWLVPLCHIYDDACCYFETCFIWIGNGYLFSVHYAPCIRSYVILRMALLYHGPMVAFKLSVSD